MDYTSERIMNFTDKEMTLARQLKEDGIIWVPKIGDHFLHRGKIYIVRDLSVDDSVFAIRSYPYDMRSYPYDADCIFALCYCTWLPLWHQCRKILGGNDLYILLLTKKNDDIQLDVWKYDDGHKTSRGRYMGLVRGETDLETMYKAIGLYVLD